MALSDKTILQSIEQGDRVIEPFNRANLSTSSYDVTLGSTYWTEKPAAYGAPIYNPYSKTETERIWIKNEAQPAQNVCSQSLENIKPTDKVILIKPGETILAHTLEYIGGKNHITTMMKARSSLGRSFISVCKCAGWGDVGYVNRWTMEITNYSQFYSIPLVVGRRIAQIVFFETGPILEKDYSDGGKYQSSNDLETIQANWNPEDMVPKLYKDRDIGIR